MVCKSGKAASQEIETSSVWLSSKASQEEPGDTSCLCRVVALCLARSLGSKLVFHTGDYSFTSVHWNPKRNQTTSIMNFYTSLTNKLGFIETF